MSAFPAGVQAVTPHPPSSGGKICTTTTLRAPLPETIMFVNYHINIGVDHLFLFFDDPNDRAIVQLAEYRSVTCIGCDAEHWKRVGCEADSHIEERQILNANLALTWAREMGYDWIAHIDSDELIHVETPLKSLLLGLSEAWPVLWFPSLEAVPQKMKYSRPFEEMHLFKALPTRDHHYFRGKNEAAFFRGEFFRGHTGGKSAVRTAAEIATLSLHRPLDNKHQPLPALRSRNAMLLHYDCYDFDAWYTKWLRRCDGTATAGGRPNRLAQFEAFKALYEKRDIEGMKQFYRRLYFLPDHVVESLKEEGMIREIQLNPGLFHLP